MALLPINIHDFADIRLIASDVDGTLTQNGKFTAGFIATLQRLQASGIKVLLVTGRSAGWVSALVNYLPIEAAIAENGGIYLHNDQQYFLSDITNPTQHRLRLEQAFHQIQKNYPNLQPSMDNQFRITDWTFDIHGLADKELDTIARQCNDMDLGFTYSTVQCHIKLSNQDKSTGLKLVLAKFYQELELYQVLTVGDSPNDESMFVADQFPLSVGVANIRHYQDKMVHLPKYVTQSSEFAGFSELIELILKK
ncbi:HAD family hydrolase [Pseudanabaena yagii]|uniref:HAD family phosphatase n=1 Tax=Pseudanabaena yagii GIHE-NHR1 TaxID=2722753 RepID=A0ABX1M0D5_9CYAN|nr:HAD family hydrolase [Pseudanabaena yagii]NMF60656.1 HAD family phosphatase [Pseudanabaena yagii GIHE-NHR1]